MDNNELNKQLEWYRKHYGPYIEKRGLQNWRNLFKKPNILELTIFFMIIMSLFMGWAYQKDTQLCHETLNNISSICNSLTIQPSGMINRSVTFNVSAFDKLIINGTSTYRNTS